MSQNEHGQYRVSVARSFEELEALRPFWEEANHTLDADLDYFSAVVRSRDNVICPHVICLSRDGRPVSLLVGRLETIRLKCKFGYKNIYQPQVRSLTIVYGGLAGDDSAECVRAIVAELLRILSAREADVVSISQAWIESEFYRQARGTPNIFCRDYLKSPNVHWSLELPESFEALLKTRSSKSRYNMKRQMRLLEQAFENKLELKCFQRKDELEQLMRDLEQISAKTYQRGLGVGFAATAEHRALLEVQLEKNWLRVHVLYLDGVPGAYTLGCRYRDRFVYGSIGFDPNFQKYEVGNYLRYKLFDEMCGDPQIKHFDYGFGDSDYKSAFSTEHWYEANVLIFAPTLRGMRINLLRTAVLKAAEWTKQFAQKLQLEQKIKKIWRKKLSNPEPQEAESRAES